MEAEKEILDHVGLFYSKLYTSDNTNINKLQRLMNHIENPNTLTLQQHRECEEKIFTIKYSSNQAYIQKT